MKMKIGFTIILVFALVCLFTVPVVASNHHNNNAQHHNQYYKTPHDAHKNPYDKPTINVGYQPNQNYNGYCHIHMSYYCPSNCPGNYHANCNGKKCGHGRGWHR